MEENRVAVIALIVEDSEAVESLNALLHQYRRAVIGRMGLPCRERGISLISVAMDAPADQISALSGKLGRLPGVTAKTVYAPAGCGHPSGETGRASGNRPGNTAVPNSSSEKKGRSL